MLARKRKQQNKTTINKTTNPGLKTSGDLEV
jgi:hypothetical protein